MPAPQGPRQEGPGAAGCPGPRGLLQCPERAKKAQRWPLAVAQEGLERAKTAQKGPSGPRGPRPKRTKKAQRGPRGPIGPGMPLDLGNVPWMRVARNGRTRGIGPEGAERGDDETAKGVEGDDL